jgi:hypothetical protein
VNANPNIYVTWEESAEPLISFLRYEVWRRVQASPANDWVKIARISDRARTSYQDFLSGSYGTTYEYDVTVAANDSAGNEISSDHTAGVAVSMVIRSFFLHDVAAPEHYAEVRGNGAEVEPQQELELVQVWARRTPTAHVGPRRARGIGISALRGWDAENDAWLALVDLQARQYETGAVLCLRGYRDAPTFCVIRGMARSDEGVLWSIALDLAEVFYDPEVA